MELPSTDSFTSVRRLCSHGALCCRCRRRGTYGGSVPQTGSSSYARTTVTRDKAALRRGYLGEDPLGVGFEVPEVTIAYHCPEDLETVHFPFPPKKKKSLKTPTELIQHSLLVHGGLVSMPGGIHFWVWLYPRRPRFESYCPEEAELGLRSCGCVWQWSQWRQTLQAPRRRAKTERSLRAGPSFMLMLEVRCSSVSSGSADPSIRCSRNAWGRGENHGLAEVS